MELRNHKWLINGNLPTLSQERLLNPTKAQTQNSYDLEIHGLIVASEQEAEELAYWGVECDSYERIAKIAQSFDAPMDIYINSPGGVVHPSIEKAAKALGQQKHNFFVDMCCSAAYWLASSGNIVANSKLSVIGSIGVITGYHEDDKKWKQVRSSASPDKAILPEENEEAYVSENLDPIYNVFEEHVTSNRDIKEEALTGKAYYPDEALKLGLINSKLKDYEMSKELKEKIAALESQMEQLKADSDAKVLAAKEEAQNALQAEQQKYLTAKELAGKNGELETILMSVENLSENKDIFEKIIASVKKDIPQPAPTVEQPKAESKNATASTGIKVNRKWGAL